MLLPSMSSLFAIAVVAVANMTQQRPLRCKQYANGGLMTWDFRAESWVPQLMCAQKKIADDEKKMRKKKCEEYHLSLFFPHLTSISSYEVAWSHQHGVHPSDNIYIITYVTLFFVSFQSNSRGDPIFFSCLVLRVSCNSNASTFDTSNAHIRGNYSIVRACIICT